MSPTGPRAHRDIERGKVPSAARVACIARSACTSLDQNSNKQLFERSEFLIATSLCTYLVRTRTFSKNDFPFDEIYRRLLFFTLGTSTTAVSPFLYYFTMSWWVNSWISDELQLCCCRNKSRVRASHEPVRKFIDCLGRMWFAHARASVCTLLLHAPGLVSCVRHHASCKPCTSLF